MIKNILKKDIKRKKAMNIIIVIFIVLSTVFLASGVNNLLITNSALSYFAKESALADYCLLSYSEPKIEEWAANNANIQEIEMEEHIALNHGDIKIGNQDYEMQLTMSMCKVPARFNLVLDEEDQIIHKVKDGEIGLTYQEGTRQNLRVGDVITICLGDVKKDLKIAYLMKDMIFGSSYMGWTRAVISDTDYEEFAGQASEKVVMYSLQAKDAEKLNKELSEQNFFTIVQFDQEIIRFTYILDIMIFAALIIVALCLMVIAFIVLRFSIVFTLQEDYKEIGIMKAIGLENKYIKKIYLIKYIFLAIIGTAVGVILSIPFGDLFMETVRHQLVMESGTVNYIRSIFCAIFVIIMVILFCYITANKVNNYTAIQAIRGGVGGEHFRRKSIIKLHNSKRMPAICYMAVNDIFSNIKNYSVLLTVFILGTILVIIPANIANTLQDESLVQLFSIIQTDIYIDNNKYNSYSGNETGLRQDLAEMEKQCREENIEIDVHAEKLYMGYISIKNKSRKVLAYTIQAWGMEGTKYKYLEGKAPILENEIAITPLLLEDIGVKIGDSVDISFGGDSQTCIITGTYQTMMNMGLQVRLAEAFPVEESYLVGVHSIQGQFRDREDINQQRDEFKEFYSEYGVSTADEHLDKMIHSVRESIEELKILILIVVVFINCLISVLMCKVLITKDIGNIAFLKSIGFRNKDIRLWQGLRIVLIMLLSLLAGIILAKPLTKVAASATFGMMGASSIDATVIMQEVYILYPAILLLATVIAIGITTINIRKIGLKELGNLE